MVKLREVRTTRLEGLEAWAREQGVSYHHAYRVYIGDRRSKRLEAEFAKAGIKCHTPPPKQI